MIRILNAEPERYSPDARRILEEVGDVVEAPLDRDELLSELPHYDVLIVRLKHAIDREVLAAGKRLRAVVTATTGLNHIDLEGARERGIEVLSLFGETEFLRNVSATAEHTWALLLALARRIPEASASVREGFWERDRFRGWELSEKRLGILGLGRIGRKVARYGQAFGMRVGACDPGEEWMEGVERAATLQDLLLRSDVLTLHVPLKPATQGLIGSTELALLPRSAILVNTSRGEVVEEMALLHALQSGRLAGAALDVIAHEQEQERRRQSVLLAYARAHENLLITPHVGGATRESMARTEVFMARKLAAFLRNPRSANASARSPLPAPV